GQLDGDGGGYWLDYAAWHSPVAVNLAAGSGTALGGVAGVQHVLGSFVGGDSLVGSALGSILVGHGSHNTLIGTGGHNVLIGGFGANLLVGGPGDELIFAGATAYDASTEVQAAVFTEWGRTASITLRVVF